MKSNWEVFNNSYEYIINNAHHFSKEMGRTFLEFNKDEFSDLGDRQLFTLLITMVNFNNPRFRSEIDLISASNFLRNKELKVLPLKELFLKSLEEFYPSYDLECEEVWGDILFPGAQFLEKHLNTV